jgi:hypothetical protein
MNERWRDTAITQSFIPAFFRGLTFVAIFMLLFVFESRAGDFWKDKQFDSWSIQEARTILNDSPWTKRVIRDAPWIKGNAGFLSILPVGCDGRPDMSKRSEPPPMEMAMYTRVEFRVNWNSSKTMRAAKMQESILCGNMDKETAEGMLENGMDYFQIEMLSPDMKPFESMEDEEIRENTSLTFKKTQKKVIADDIRIQRLPGQKRIISITFAFNKKTDAGEAYLASDEKEIEFISQAGNFSVKTKFQPSKMSAKDGPDL